MMASERWAKVKNILYEALDMSPAQRSSFLDEKWKIHPGELEKKFFFLNNNCNSSSDICTGADCAGTELFSVVAPRESRRFY